MGLQTLLRNVEASAQGVVRPARLIVAHRPLGTARWAFTPRLRAITGSRVLQPFGNQGLSSDMIVLSGVSTAHLNLVNGGAHEQGTVHLVTGVRGGGTRSNCCEGDDVFAAGPSFDQVFIERSAALRTPPIDYVNVACDARTDFGEISTKCISYSRHKSLVGLHGGGTALENIPLMPFLSPFLLYNHIFLNFFPGGATAQNREALTKARADKQSVLDLMLGELRRLESLGPSSEKAVMEAQLAAIRDIERTLDASAQSACVRPPEPPSTMSGVADPIRGEGNYYDRPTVSSNDAPNLATVARNHWALIKAAFICDLTRVATFQLEPSTGHVGFMLYPDDISVRYRHHPASHAVTGAPFELALPPAPVPPMVEFLVSVEEWYNTLFAELVADFKATTDPFGNNLLGTTVVPYVTEVRNPGHARSGMPAVIFGGRDLGMLGNQYRPESVTINSLWGAIGQAFNVPVSAPLSTPMPNLWAPPPP